MGMWISRRKLIGMVVGTSGAVWSAERARGGEVPSTAACYWRRVNRTCSGGTAREYWCYRCCDLTGCGDVYWEWRVVGSC
jgi:hypothetical protein